MALDVFSAKKQTDESTTLKADSTAVLVVDMVNDFCKPGGAMVLPGYEALVGPQTQILNAARGAGAPVIFIVDAHRANVQDREFKKRAPHCIEGKWGSQVIDELPIGPGDYIVTKRRYSGFFNTDLDLTLKDLGIDTLIVFGVVTNICVRSTVHDAFFNGYETLVPQDCVAATSPREQMSSLYDIATHFGIVCDANEVVAGLRDGARIFNREIPVE